MLRSLPLANPHITKIMVIFFFFFFFFGVFISQGDCSVLVICPLFHGSCCNQTRLDHPTKAFMSSVMSSVQGRGDWKKTMLEKSEGREKAK